MNLPSGLEVRPAVLPAGVGGGTAHREVEAKRRAEMAVEVLESQGCRLFRRLIGWGSPVGGEAQLRT